MVDYDYDILEKMNQQSNDVDVQVEKEVTLKMVTFNILAPIYKRIITSAGSKAFESDYPELFLERNMKICMELLDTHADIICLQEFWSGSDVLKQLYIDYLCKPNAHNDSPYSMRILTRTSYWRSRGDSIAIFVKNDSLEIQDVQEILFHDCGDRVALMLLLGLRPSGQNTPSMMPPSSTSIPTDPSSATDASSSPRSLSTDQLPPTMSPVNNQGPQLCTTDSSQERPLQRFICVNTHLLFPHNPYSSQIRLREITKILGFIEAYKQKDLCSTVCDRADVRLPVIIAGDFNGSPKGSVYKYIRSQNFRSAMEEYYNDDASEEVEVINAEGTTLTDGSDDDDIDKIEVVEDYLNGGQPSDSIDDVEDTSINTTIDGDRDEIQQNNPHVVTVVPSYSIDQSSAPSSSSSSSSPLYGGTASIERWNNWVSHKSHLGKDVAVDHIFYLNPSEQTKELLPPLPDWTNLVWREIMQRIVDQQGGAAITREVFRSFDQDGSSYVTREEFKTALLSLGFVGENCPCLTNEEIDMLVYSADKNADGLIDYKEFYDRFWLASVVQQRSNQLLSPSDEDQSIADAVDNDISDIGSGFGDDRVNDDDDDDSIGTRSDITQDSSSDSIETNLNSNRLLLARSKWLTERIDPSIITTTTTTKDDEEQADKMMIYDQYAERNNIIEVCSELDSGEMVVLLEPMQSYMHSLSEENKHFFEAMYLNRNNDYLNSDGISGDNSNNNNNNNNNSSSSSSSDDNNSHVITDGSQSLVDYAYSKSNRINVVPLGDLSVVSVRIIPKEMENGVWPADYSLSDHGLIECVFKAKVNT
jgi:endonuclease/exonuclease/phosphatase family metal-dependent hydrolase